MASEIESNGMEMPQCSPMHSTERMSQVVKDILSLPLLMDHLRAFVGMEENADGSAPADDRAVLKAAFDKLDADKSGKLSKKECQALMESQLGKDDGSFAERLEAGLEAKLNEEQGHELDFDQFLEVYYQVRGKSCVRFLLDGILNQSRKVSARLTLCPPSYTPNVIDT